MHLKRLLSVTGFGAIVRSRGSSSRIGGAVRAMTSSPVTGTVSELTIPVPWGSLRGKRWGPEHGHPVLCLHGWSDNCGTFDTLLPLLPKDYQYVAIDLAGHGHSSHRPAGVLYAFPSYVLDVCRVVNALQWSKFSIIAHSMGGNVAGVFSALYPDKVDALVLLDSFGFFPTEVKEIPKVMRQGLDEMIQYEKKTAEENRRVYTYEKALERLMSVNRDLSEKSAKILLQRGSVEVEGGVVFSRDFRINLKNVARITTDQVVELQSRIEASVLIVIADNGLEKMFVQPEQKKFLSDLLQLYRDKNNTIVTVPGDHHIHLNNPQVIAPLVSQFLREKVPSQLAVSELSVPVPWGEIRGRSWGPDDGYPILCLHGWADNAGSFDGLLPLLPKEYRYVAVDLAGHGFSSHRAPGVPYLLTDYVSDVRRVADGLRWTKFSIIGHSMGGDIAGMFSALYPEMVDALVLLDIYGFVVTHSGDLSTSMRQGLDEMLKFDGVKDRNNKIYTFEKAKERLSAANPGLSEESLHTLLKRGLTQVEGGFVFSRDLRVNFKQVDRFSLELCLTLQSKIEASVLVLLAEEGFGAPSKQPQASKLLQGYKDRNHTVVTVAGDHHVHLNNPEVVALLVSDFLQSKVISWQLTA